jgi:hypothetical protein
MAKLVASELAFLGQWEMDGETVPVLPYGKDVIHPSLPEQVLLAEVEGESHDRFSFLTRRSPME